MEILDHLFQHWLLHLVIQWFILRRKGHEKCCNAESHYFLGKFIKLRCQKGIILWIFLYNSKTVVKSTIMYSWVLAARTFIIECILVCGVSNEYISVSNLIHSNYAQGTAFPSFNHFQFLSEIAICFKHCMKTSRRVFFCVCVCLCYSQVSTFRFIAACKKAKIVHPHSLQQDCTSGCFPGICVVFNFRSTLSLLLLISHLAKLHVCYVLPCLPTFYLLLSFTSADFVQCCLITY